MARAGLRQRRVTRWLSLALAVLTVVVLLFGFGYATGVVRSVAGLPGLWVHVAVALALATTVNVPLLVKFAVRVVALWTSWVKPKAAASAVALARMIETETAMVRD